jgi:hypothetical protein
VPAAQYEEMMAADVAYTLSVSPHTEDAHGGLSSAMPSPRIHCPSALSDRKGILAGVHGGLPGVSPRVAPAAPITASSNMIMRSALFTTAPMPRGAPPSRSRGPVGEAAEGGELSCRVICQAPHTESNRPKTTCETIERPPWHPSSTSPVTARTICGQKRTAREAEEENRADLVVAQNSFCARAHPTAQIAPFCPNPPQYIHYLFTRDELRGCGSLDRSSGTLQRHLRQHVDSCRVSAPVHLTVWSSSSE